MKVKIIEFSDINEKTIKVFIDIKNIFGNYRKIEIGIYAFNTLSLKLEDEIIIYEYKKNDFKINYEETFKLYNKKYIKYKK